MDVRQLISAKRELLINSLSPSSTEFLYFLLEKQKIDYAAITTHKEQITTIQKTDDLINLICKRGSTDLALHFLQWMRETDQNDLHEAITEGRNIESLTSPDSADAVTSQCYVTDSVEEDAGESECESLSTSTSPLLDIDTVMPTRQYMDDMLEDSSGTYSLSSPVRGVAMLIANSKFQYKPAYNRDGSECDINNLYKLFASLGYQVLVHSNITARELIAKIHTLTRDKKQRTYSSFVLCILSRGGIGSITMTDMSEIYTDELLDRLDSNNFPAMAGKPKLIYIDINNQELQADTGLLLPRSNEPHHKLGRTGPLEDIQIVQSSTVRNVQDSRRHADLSTPVIDEYCTKVACKADFVILLASFPRFTALHHKVMGSISTRVLVETFHKHAHRLHVAELAMKIRRKLSSKVLSHSKQVLTTVDTLTKKFYIFPVLS